MLHIALGPLAPAVRPSFPLHPVNTYLFIRAQFQTICHVFSGQEMLRVPTVC